MTTYAFPTLSVTAPPAARWGLKSNTQVFTSPLNGAVQTLELLGARWTVGFSLETLPKADARLLRAFIAKLRGQANRFTLSPFEMLDRSSTISLSGVTLGASVAQLANSCTLNGCGAGATLLQGEFFTVAGELKMATNDSTANGSGVMTGVTFEPMVRTAGGWSSGASVTTSGPTATMMLTDPHATWNTRAPMLSDFEFNAVEVW